jgi:FkbM family methyltransferase
MLDRVRQKVGYRVDTLKRWQLCRGQEFRPGTNDRDVFLCVTYHNEYELPRTFSPDDTVIDIGAHIGSFAYAALSRGAGRVLSFEANGANAGIARRNLATFGARAEVIEGAVWRSDEPEHVIQFSPSDDPRNLAGGGIRNRPGAPVRAIAFDDVLEEVGGTVRMVKLDCEGSEYPILMTSKRLDQVQDIRGEFHLNWHGEEAVRGFPAFDGRFGPEGLAEVLREQGFLVRWHYNRQSSRLGYFFATR